MKKKKNRKEYNRKYMHNVRQNLAFKAKELEAQRKHKHKARQAIDYKAKELESQRKYKQKPGKIEITKRES